MTKTYAITRASSATFTQPTNNKQLPIPKSISQAKNLREELLNDNQLTRCLPYEIGLLANATGFNLSANSLTGPIPESFQCLAHLEKLSLAKNQLYGSVPDTMCKISKLVQLDLSDNYLSEIGPECTKLIAKKVVDPKGNCINGLPNQRSKAECDAFLSKPKSCPAQNTIPCS